MYMVGQAVNCNQINLSNGSDLWVLPYTQCIWNNLFIILDKEKWTFKHGYQYPGNLFMYMKVRLIHLHL